MKSAACFEMVPWPLRLLSTPTYYGLDDAWTTYDLMEAAERARWVAWAIGGLGIALAVTVWQAASLRQRKRSEAALREGEARFRAIFSQAAVGITQHHPNQP